MSIADIVNVTITRETPVLTQVGFGTLLILGTHKVFNDRINFFSSLEEVQTAGFASTSPEFVAASSVFAQNPSVVNIAIGRRSADLAVVTVDEATAGQSYVVTINGVDFTHVATMGQDAEDIALALVALINLGAEPVTATDNLDGTFDIVADVADVAYTLSVSSLMSFIAASSASIADDLQAVINQSDDFYGVMITSRVEQDVLDTAAFVETRLKIFGTASDDSDILTTADTDIASQLQALNYARTFIMYHQNAATAYPEAAWFGRQLPAAPGSTTWAFKQLSGIPVSTLTSNQRANVLGKNANTYELRGGANIAREGKVVEGDYIDIIRGTDWLKTRLTERIFNRLVTSPKIPYTDAGVALIESDIRAQLDAAIAQNVIALDPAYTVTVPFVRDVSVIDKGNRFLPDVRFQATLAGGIHSVVVNGTVSI